jgi:hypothetical protein
MSFSLIVELFPQTTKEFGSFLFNAVNVASFDDISAV